MSRPLRILHIGNGRAFKIKAIVDAFVRRGHELHVVPIPPSAEAWSGVEWHSLPIAALPAPARVPARMWQVRRLAHRIGADVVHSHNAWGPAWYGALAGRRPHLIHAYGGDLLPEQTVGRPAWQRALTARACRGADRLIVTGRHMVSAAVKLGVAAERVLLLPRGVDLEAYRPGLDTSGLRVQLELGDRWPVVLSPRYQIDETLYNLDVVIEAFARLRQRLPSAVCVQMADPSRTDGWRRLAALAAQRGLGDSYRLAPSVDNTQMPLYYNLATVVASVPSSDGFPVTVLEASACAAPLVVSRLPYCDDWFVDGENGLIVPVRDSQALAGALAAVCEDAELARRLGAASRRLVAERADYQRCMDLLEHEYRVLVDAVDGSRRARR